MQQKKFRNIDFIFLPIHMGSLHNVTLYYTFGYLNRGKHKSSLEIIRKQQYLLIK